MDRQITAYLVKLRRDHPFFATLSLYMDYEFTCRVEQFDVDGRKARLNPRYFERISPAERVGTLLHLTLHCALLHQTRCGPRILSIWNIAADIVVNQIIQESNYAPPPATAVEPRYADKSVEYIYAKLLTRAAKLVNQTNESQFGKVPKSSDTLNAACQPQSDIQNDQAEALQLIYPSVKDIQPSCLQSKLNINVEQKQTETYWRNALLRAATVERLSTTTKGLLPLGMSRAIHEVVNPQLDWRTVLWRFMIKTPCDYSGFDRRFIHQGLYLEHLEGESLTVHIAMDTSGSVGDDQLAQFRAEVETIVRCYSAIKGQLYFVDSEVYGPHSLSSDISLVEVDGGGGTDFRVLFQLLEEDLDPFEDVLCIYLTDGYGDFPKRPPPFPVLWVATEDATDHFPFGEVTRLI